MSLTYILTRKPKKPEDFIDLAKRQNLPLNLDIATHTYQHIYHPNVVGQDPDIFAHETLVYLTIPGTDHNYTEIVDSWNSEHNKIHPSDESFKQSTDMAKKRAENINSLAATKGVECKISLRS